MSAVALVVEASERRGYLMGLRNGPPCVKNPPFKLHRSTLLTVTVVSGTQGAGLNETKRNPL